MDRGVWCRRGINEKSRKVDLDTATYFDKYSPILHSQSAISALVEVLLYQKKYYAKSTPIPNLEK